MTGLGMSKLSQCVCVQAGRKRTTQVPHNLLFRCSPNNRKRDREILIKSPDILLALKGKTIFAFLTKRSDFHPQPPDNLTRIKIRGPEDLYSTSGLLPVLSLCTDQHQRVQIGSPSLRKTAVTGCSLSPHGCEIPAGLNLAVATLPGGSL